MPDLPTEPERTARTSFPRGIVLLAMSGWAALAYELLWTRRMIDLLGATAESSARVFGCFFLGLALGAATTPYLLGRTKRPWRAAALSEIGTALFALPSLLLSRWADAIWPALGPARLAGWDGAFIKLVLSVIIVLPPAFCMGLTFPLVTAAVLRGRYRSDRHGVWLYAANTLGGVGGLMGVASFTLRQYGVTGSILAAMGINLFVAAGCLFGDLNHVPADQPRRRAPAGVPRPRHRVLGPALVIAFVSGMAILAFEILGLQLVSQVAPLSLHAPAAFLAVVLFSLGTAALALPVLTRWSRGQPRVIWFALLGGALATLIIPWWFSQVVTWIDVGPRSSLPRFLAALAGVCLVTFGPVVLLGGLVFPATMAWLGQAGGDARGRYWGWLLAVNGLGGLLGAELAYRVILPRGGIHVGLGWLAILYALTALVWAAVRAPRKPAGLAVSAGILILTIIVTRTQLTCFPDVRVAPATVLHTSADRQGTLAVVESNDLGRRIIMSSQYVLGGTKLRYDQARLAHIPLLLHRQPRAVACIGLATGITPGAALQHRDVKSITAIELSPAVVRAAEHFFQAYNHDVTHAPRATVVVEDGRTYLAAARDQFDVVIGDLFLPWSPGTGRMYSLEHFQNVHDALRSGGLFCQWLPMYQLTPRQFDMILVTFCRVFPRVDVFRDAFSCEYPILGLVGFRDGSLDWTTVRARCDAVRKTHQLRDPLVRHVEGLALLALGNIDPTRLPRVPVNTLANVALELDAGRERVTGQPSAKYLSENRWLTFVDDRFLRQLGPNDGRSRDQLRLAWIGQCLALWEALRAHRASLPWQDASQIPVLRAEIQRGFPRAIAHDTHADWSRWPGDRTLIETIPAPE